MSLDNDSNPTIDYREAYLRMVEERNYERGCVVEKAEEVAALKQTIAAFQKDKERWLREQMKADREVQSLRAELAWYEGAVPSVAEMRALRAEVEHMRPVYDRAVRLASDYHVSDDYPYPGHKHRSHVHYLFTQGGGAYCGFVDFVMAAPSEQETPSEGCIMTALEKSLGIGASSEQETPTWRCCDTVHPEPHTCDKASEQETTDA